MDTVRFGRVLGHGARQAAKTIVSAVDAATAPNPNPAPNPAASPAARSPQPASPSPSRPSPTLLPPQQQPPVATVLPPVAPQKTPVPHPARGLAEGGRRFGRAVWGPAVRLSGVLWLELTGVFFGLFALVAGIATWRLHAAVFPIPAPSSLSPALSASEDRTRFFFAAGMVLVFGYFSLSSFLKASRRSRRP